MHAAAAPSTDQDRSWVTVGATDNEINITTFLDFKGRGAIVEHLEYDEKGQLVPIFTSYEYRADSGSIYCGIVNRAKLSISLQEAVASLCKIPDHEIFPLAYDGLTTVDLSLCDQIHIKHPKARSWRYAVGTTRIAECFLAEARILEQLRLHPHRNIVHFLGCVVRCGRVTGLATRQYPMGLREWRKRKLVDQFTTMIQEIEGAIIHIHSLGLAHNDINPNNIMVDEGGHAILIDFGSARPFGEELHEGGTTGFNDGFEIVSSIHNDVIGLAKLRAWLETGSE